jgi:hypothetical protein
MGLTPVDATGCRSVAPLRAPGQDANGDHSYFLLSGTIDGTSIILEWKPRDHSRTRRGIEQVVTQSPESPAPIACRNASLSPKPVIPQNRTFPSR